MWKVYAKRHCKRISPMLWGFAAGTLPEGDLERVEEHLLCCQSCRQEAGEYKLAVRLLNGAQRQPAPESKTGWLAVRACLENESRFASRPAQPARKPVFANLALGGATLAAAAVCALVLTRVFPDAPVVPSETVRSGDVKHAPQTSAQNQRGDGDKQPGPSIAVGPEKPQPKKTATAAPTHAPRVRRHLDAAEEREEGSGFEARISLAGAGSEIRQPDRHSRVHDYDYARTTPEALLPHSSLRSPGAQLDVDGMRLVKTTDLDFVPGTNQSQSGAAAPQRQYVMDAIPISSAEVTMGNVTQGDQHSGSEASKAW